MPDKIRIALDALTAIQKAIGMPISGDSSDFVWPKSTMRHPGETASGWICEKHGLGYQSGCICCVGDMKAYRERKDREARYAREDAISDASKKVRAAIAALEQPEEAAAMRWTHEQLHAAFETQIKHVSHVHYDSNEICRHFYGEFIRELLTPTTPKD